MNHGLSYHPLFGRWYRMIRRCEDPTDLSYENYGGRGILVFVDWLDPANYINYVERELGLCPGPGYSLDRIDNERGYEPGNLRWATRSVQNANQRQRISVGYPAGASGFRGVRLHKKTGRWQARLQRDGGERSLGYYDTPDEAARAYDRVVLALGERKVRLNFPDEA